MERVLLNRKAVNSRKTLKKNRKDSLRGYYGRRSISKTRIGKFLVLTPGEKVFPTEPPEIAEDRVEAISSEVSLDRILELLESTGLTGMSGNGFPVKKKLELLLQYPSQKYLLINGVECEPGLLHDEWILENHREEISRGIELLSGVIPFSRCVLARKLRKAERKHKRESSGFEEIMIAARYPMGAERLLIRQVFGKELASGIYPADEGILVMNVQTVYQIYCLLTGQYQTGRFVTLADLDRGIARVEYVKRGENIRERLKSCFPEGNEANYYAGSGVMSAHIAEEDEVFSDAISFAAVGQPADISNAAACKGCGLCSRKCPSGVNVKEIVKRREKDSKADISGLGAEKCIHCGSCTYFCGAGKDIAEYLEEK